MGTNSNNGGVPPSALALRDSLNQKPDTSSDPTMLTPSQLELLRQGELEIDEYLAKSSQSDLLLARSKTLIAGE
jgi:hypothetical protein